MRGETDEAKLQVFMRALGERVRSEGTICLTGGATAVQEGLVDVSRLRAAFDEIEPVLIRYPAIDPAWFRSAVMEFCDGMERRGTADDA